MFGKHTHFFKKDTAENRGEEEHKGIREIEALLAAHFNVMHGHRLKPTRKKNVLEFISTLYGSPFKSSLHYFFNPKTARTFHAQTVYTENTGSTVIVLGFRPGSVKLYRGDSRIPERVSKIELDNLEGMSDSDIEIFKKAYTRLVESHGGALD